MTKSSWQIPLVWSVRESSPTSWQIPLVWSVRESSPTSWPSASHRCLPDAGPAVGSRLVHWAPAAGYAHQARPQHLRGPAEAARSWGGTCREEAEKTGEEPRWLQNLTAPTWHQSPYEVLPLWSYFCVFWTKPLCLRLTKSFACKSIPISLRVKKLNLTQWAGSSLRIREELMVVLTFWSFSLVSRVHS